MERFLSGLRINQAADDPADIAVSEKYVCKSVD